MSKKISKLSPINIRPDILLDIDKMDLKELTDDDLIEMGKSVTEVNTYAQWLLGRLVDEVVKRRGDIEKYANAIGQRRDKLYQCVYVYRKFIKDNPDFSPEKYVNGSIPWGMLQYVASKSDTPIKLLNDLIDEGIVSQPAAIRKIKEQETGIVVPPKPRVSWKWNAEKEKWTIRFMLDEMDLIDWDEARDLVLEKIKGSIKGDILINN